MAACDHLRSTHVSNPLSFIGKAIKNHQRMVSKDNTNNILQTTAAAISSKICTVFCCFFNATESSEGANIIYLCKYIFCGCIYVKPGQYSCVCSRGSDLEKLRSLLPLRASCKRGEVRNCVIMKKPLMSPYS